VGYKVSPILWDKVRPWAFPLGRVQTVALRLIVDARNADPRLRSTGILGRFTRCWMPGSRRFFEAKLFKTQRPKISRSQTRRPRDKIVATVSKAKWAGGRRHAKRKEAQSSSAFHDLSKLQAGPPTTGCATPPSARLSLAPEKLYEGVGAW